MKELSQNSGIQFDGAKYTAKFVTGGSSFRRSSLQEEVMQLLSYNEFIKQFNKYGSILPNGKSNRYSGVNT